MPQLKSVEFGFNKFCGPSVLSILTGKSTDECAAVISKVNGHYNVAGVMLHDLLIAANQLGFETTNMNLGGVSLYRALVSIAPRGNATYIVTVTGHFVCIEVTNGRLFFCDNHTKEPIPAASSARLSMNVEAIHKVIKNPDYVEPSPPKPKPNWVLVTRWMCPECCEIASKIEYIFHSPNCKWRGYTDETEP